MKKIMILLATLLLCAMAFTACGGEEDTEVVLEGEYVLSMLDVNGFKMDYEKLTKSGANESVIIDGTKITFDKYGKLEEGVLDLEAKTVTIQDVVIPYTTEGDSITLNGSVDSEKTIQTFTKEGSPELK